MDGTATLDYLAAADELVAVRVTADLIGTQEFQLIERANRQSQGPVITLRLKPTSHLAGRVRTARAARWRIRLSRSGPGAE